MAWPPKSTPQGAPPAEPAGPCASFSVTVSSRSGMPHVRNPGLLHSAPVLLSLCRRLWSPQCCWHQPGGVGSVVLSAAHSCSHFSSARRESFSMLGAGSATPWGNPPGSPGEGILSMLPISPLLSRAPVSGVPSGCV